MENKDRNMCIQNILKIIQIYITFKFMIYYFIQCIYIHYFSNIYDFSFQFYVLQASSSRRTFFYSSKSSSQMAKGNNIVSFLQKFLSRTGTNIFNETTAIAIRFILSSKTREREGETVIGYFIYRRRGYKILEFCIVVSSCPPPLVISLSLFYISVSVCLSSFIRAKEGDPLERWTR